MAEYYFSLEDPAKVYGYELPKEEHPTAVRIKKPRHHWTPMENAVIYTVWATEANKPDVNPQHLAGGQVKYEMEHMVDKVRELAKGTFDVVSNDAILCQLSRCGYTLLEANNDFTSKKYEQMFIELHKELKIWNEQQIH